MIAYQTQQLSVPITGGDMGVFLKNTSLTGGLNVCFRSCKCDESFRVYKSIQLKTDMVN